MNPGRLCGWQYFTAGVIAGSIFGCGEIDKLTAAFIASEVKVGVGLVITDHKRPAEITRHCGAVEFIITAWASGAIVILRVRSHLAPVKGVSQVVEIDLVGIAQSHGKYFQAAVNRITEKVSVRNGVTAVLLGDDM